MPWPPGRCQGGDFPGRTPAHQIGPCGVWKATMSRLITTSMAHIRRGGIRAGGRAEQPCSSPPNAANSQSPAQWRRSEQLRHFREHGKAGRVVIRARRDGRWRPRTPSRMGTHQHEPRAVGWRAARDILLPPGARDTEGLESHVALGMYLQEVVAHPLRRVRCRSSRSSACRNRTRPD